MPLVKTPMIAPTKIYNNVPTLEPDEAADMIIRAIVYKPVRIATRPVFGQVLHAIRATHRADRDEHQLPHVRRQRRREGQEEMKWRAVRRSTRAVEPGCAASTLLTICLFGSRQHRNRRGRNHGLLHLMSRRVGAGRGFRYWVVPSAIGIANSSFVNAQRESGGSSTI